MCSLILQPFKRLTLKLIQDNLISHLFWGTLNSKWMHPNKLLRMIRYNSWFVRMDSKFKMSKASFWCRQLRSKKMMKNSLMTRPQTTEDSFGLRKMKQMWSTIHQVCGPLSLCSNTSSFKMLTSTCQHSMQMTLSSTYKACKWIIMVTICVFRRVKETRKCFQS